MVVIRSILSILDYARAAGRGTTTYIIRATYTRTGDVWRHDAPAPGFLQALLPERTESEQIAIIALWSIEDDTVRNGIRRNKVFVGRAS